MVVVCCLLLFVDYRALLAVLFHGCCFLLVVVWCVAFRVPRLVFLVVVNCSVVACVLIVACCLLFVVRCALCVVRCSFRFQLFVVCCLLIVVGGLLIVLRCPLFVVRCCC